MTDNRIDLYRALAEADGEEEETDEIWFGQRSVHGKATPAPFACEREWLGRC